MSDSDSQGGLCQCHTQDKALIRELREKLEHSLLLNGKLETQCAYLREQLQISEWRRRSRYDNTWFRTTG